MRACTSSSSRARLLSEIIAFALPIGATAFSFFANKAPPLGVRGGEGGGLGSQWLHDPPAVRCRRPLFCKAAADRVSVESRFISSFPSSQAIVAARSGMDRSLALLEQQLSSLKLRQEYAHSTSNRTQAIIHAVAMQLVQNDPTANLTKLVHDVESSMAEYLSKSGKRFAVPESDIGRDILAITDILNSSVRVLHVGVDGLTETLSMHPSDSTSADPRITIIEVGPVIWSTSPTEDASDMLGEMTRWEYSQLIKQELSERLVRAKALSAAVSWMSSMRKVSKLEFEPYRALESLNQSPNSDVSEPASEAMSTRDAEEPERKVSTKLPTTAQMLDFYTAPGEVSSTQIEELSEDASESVGPEEEGCDDEVEPKRELPTASGSLEVLPAWSAEVSEEEIAARRAREVEVERKRGSAAAARAQSRGDAQGAEGGGEGDVEGGHVLPGEHFVLIDVSGYIYRAYHKVPAMMNREGININSVRSFCVNLMRLLFQTFPQANLVAVFDPPGGSFRSELAATYKVDPAVDLAAADDDAGRGDVVTPDSEALLETLSLLSASYKANRPPPPDDLIPQFGLVREAAAAFSVPCVEVPGFEADDVIATIAKNVSEAGGQVTLISSDKDLYQLLTPTVQMYSPLDKAYILPEKVQDKFGVGPDQVAQVQALAGDSSDNVPGVPGIGVKTAAKLIDEYGSVEGLLASAAKIKQKRVRESLLDPVNAQKARVSLELVTLRTDVPVPAIPLLRRRHSDRALLQAFFDAQGISIAIPSAADKVNGPPGIAFPSGAALVSSGGLTGASASAGSAAGSKSPLKGAGAIAAPLDGLMEGAYEVVEDLEDVDRWMRAAEAEGILAVEPVATSGDGQDAELTGIAVAVKAGAAAYIPLRHFGEEGEEGAAMAEGCLEMRAVLERMRSVLEDDGVLKIGHNLKLLVALVARELEGVSVAPFDDVMLLSFTLDAGRGFDHALENLSEQYLGKKRPPLSEVAPPTGKKKTRGKLKPELLAPEGVRDFAASGADMVLHLHAVLKPRLVADGLVKIYERIERPLLPVLARMEATGVAVDILRLRGLSEGYSEQVEELEKEIFRLAGTEFSVASPKQLANVLFERLGLPAKKRGKKSDWSTGADVLEELAKDGHAIAQHIIEWRSKSKLKSTYADPLVKQVNPRTDRLHTSFCMATAVTGRLSSMDPNLQNIPNMGVGKDIRKAFIADEGYKLLSADYSQIELRLLAHIANIQPLIHAFHNNIDIHKLTASQVFGVPVEEVSLEQRKGAKAINFGIIYGQSAFGLAKQLDISQKEAKTYIDSYFAQYPGIMDYMERAKESARKHGYVETLFGRRCHIPNIGGSGSSAAYAGRKAINAPIQGTAADVIKVAMVRMEEALECAGLHARMLLQVHDELLFEVLEGEEEEAAAVIKDVMEQACLPAHPLSVPLIVEVGIGDSWEDAH